jgi:demethylmenaquinone methyltransferase/2-methoxy-6-polyprenyl-1,4-benzoquinol methylase
MIPATQRQTPPGARPSGAQTEREAGRRVREMFSRIAPRYDMLNHLLSFSLDRVWRRRTARMFATTLGRPEARVLDICCGTGDLAFALAREREKLIGTRLSTGVGTPMPPVFGSDFVEDMLARAREKANASGDAVVFSGADALALPFADQQFDLVTTAFGFRNLSNYENGLREIARVLKLGGEVGVLEFSEPEHGPLATLFRFYFRYILPRIGGAISGNREAYAYLPGSVAKFPSPIELTSLMERNGFKGVVIESWNFGSVLLHRARRTWENASTQ